MVIILLGVLAGDCASMFFWELECHTSSSVALRPWKQLVSYDLSGGQVCI